MPTAATERWPTFTVAAPVTAALFAVAVLVDANRVDLPYLAYDEWVVTAKLIALPLLEAVLVGHNAVPSYLQNLVWWLDLHWFGYRGWLPLTVHLLLLAVGATSLLHAVHRAGFRRQVALAFALLFVALWFSDYNLQQFGYYRWRTLAASAILFLLAIQAHLLISILRRHQAGTAGMVPVLFALFAAWLGLYVHGGLVLLPISALLITSMPFGWRYRSLALAVLGSYVVYFLGVHYLPVAAADGGRDVGLTLQAFAYVATSMLQVLLKPVVGAQPAQFAAVVTLVIACALVAWLWLRILTGRTDARGLLVLLLLLYPLAIAASIAYVRHGRLVDFGPEFGLIERYRSYSIYLLCGILLFFADIVVRRASGLALRGFAGVLVVPVAALGMLAVGHTLRSFDRLSALLVDHAVFMIPYSLEPHQLPPTKQSTPWRREHAERYRDALVARELGVFNTVGYHAYRDATIDSEALSSAPACMVSLIARPGDDTPHGALHRVDGRLGAPWQSQSGAVLLIDAAGRPLGWAIRHRSLADILQQWLNDATPSARIAGYLLNDRRAPAFRAALTGPDGAVGCASDSVSLPATNGL